VSRPLPQFIRGELQGKALRYDRRLHLSRRYEKLRENLYLLEYYQPQCEIALEDLTEQERKIVNEISILVRKARARLKEELKEVTVLADELVKQLKDLILLYRGNYLLPRFLYEYEKTLTKIYGRKGYEDILVTAYANGKSLLIFKTANSYLESEYFDTARKLFKRIIRTDSCNTAALFLYFFASANHFYFKSMFTRALGLAKKAEGTNVDGGIREKYLPLLTRLIADLSKEIKKRDERR
jgi:hypothetical protein